MTSALADSRPEAQVAAQEITPEQAYDSGVTDLVRGDAVAARYELDFCVARSAPDSPVRVDCLVALEKMAVSEPAPAE